MNTLPLNRASRFIFAALGGAMVAAGSRRRSLWDTGCGLAGSAMLVWAVAAPATPVAPLRDIVDTWTEDSFPASDPPSSW